MTPRDLARLRLIYLSLTADALAVRGRAGVLAAQLGRRVGPRS
jgi:hypothetical protein